MGSFLFLKSSFYGVHIPWLLAYRDGVKFPLSFWEGLWYWSECWSCSQATSMLKTSGYHRALAVWCWASQRPSLSLGCLSYNLKMIPIYSHVVLVIARLHESKMPIKHNCSELVCFCISRTKVHLSSLPFHIQLQWGESRNFHILLPLTSLLHSKVLILLLQNSTPFCPPGINSSHFQASPQSCSVHMVLFSKTKDSRLIPTQLSPLPRS